MTLQFKASSDAPYQAEQPVPVLWVNRYAGVALCSCEMSPQNMMQSPPFALAQKSPSIAKWKTDFCQSHPLESIWESNKSTALPSRCDCPPGLLFQTFSTRWWKTASAPSIPLGSWTVWAHGRTQKDPCWRCDQHSPCETCLIPKATVQHIQAQHDHFCWCKSSWFPGNQCFYSLNLSCYERLLTINVFVLLSLHG